MKQFFALTAVSALALAFAGQAEAASTTGSAAATIAAPITVAEATSLDFGTVTPSGTAGTVVINTAGARSVTGGVTEFGGAPVAASFNVTGDGSSAYSITLPSSAVTLTDGANNMTVTGFNHDAGASPALSGGTDSFAVGATLNVGANQAAGSYSGSYTVTVNYN